MDMAYVKIYADWTKATAKLREAEKGRLVDAMVIYATTGVDTSDQLSGNEQYLFPMFQASIDRDRQALAELSQRQSENGKKGGRPRKNPKNPLVFKENPKNPLVFEKTQKSEEKEKEYIYPPTPLQGEPAGCGSYVAENLRSMTGGNWEELRSFMDDGITDELVRHAVDEAAANGKRTWSYVRRILDRYLNEGITTLAQAKASDKKPPVTPAASSGLNPWLERSQQ